MRRSSHMFFCVFLRVFSAQGLISYSWWAMYNYIPKIGMIYMYFKKTNKKQPISAHLKLHMGQTKSGLAAQINPLFKKCRCDGPHSQHLAHQALHPSRHYTHLKSTPLKLWYTFRFQCVGVHIHKPSTNLAQKHYPSRPKNRPRDFDSIISGGLDHLRACCTTLRWYLSLVVDASWVLARRDDLFCFFSRRNGQKCAFSFGTCKRAKKLD